MTSTTDRRQAATETWLDTLNLDWTYEPDLDLTRVDEKASRSNQARLEALNEDVVDRYTADYERGDPFPPLLAFRRARSPKVVLIGGNHRHAAATAAGHTTHPAYLIAPGLDDHTLIRLAYEDNRRHGHAPSNDERVAQALHLIDSGLAQTEAGALVGLSRSRLQWAINAIEADRRARRLDVPPTFELLPKSTRSRLSALRSDPVFAQAATLAADAKLTTTEVFELVSELNATTSDAAALTALAAHQEQLEDRIRRTNLGADPKKDPAPAVTTLNRALFHIADLEPAHIDAQLTALARDSLPERLLAGARRLKAIHDHITRTKTR